MKRLWTLVVVTAMAFVTAVAAGAKPPPWAGGGDDGLEGGTTCLESANTDYRAEYDDDFSVGPLPAGTHCIDVSGVAPGSWSIEHEVIQGSLRSLIIQVRDSVAPGDLCGEVRSRNKREPLPSPTSLEIAGGDWVNACGTEWAELIDGQDYWEEDKNHQSPLALLLWVDGSKDLEVAFQVDVPTSP